MNEEMRLNAMNYLRRERLISDYLGRQLYEKRLASADQATLDAMLADAVAERTRLIEDYYRRPTGPSALTRRNCDGFSAMLTDDAAVCKLLQNELILVGG